MTPEAQRTALATAFPQVFRRQTGLVDWRYNNTIVRRVLPCIDGDPLKDLNAIASAEAKCNANYWYQLAKVCGINFGKVIYNITDIETVAKATAAQRAEALLRTLNLFVDDEKEGAR